MRVESSVVAAEAGVNATFDGVRRMKASPRLASLMHTDAAAQTPENTFHHGILGRKK
jgi:hypothetical protein